MDIMIDGCPDYDNDNDGVPDSLDKCPMIPEDLDGFEDDDGCPDIDNDMMEFRIVLMLVEHCRTTENGCPETKPKAKK